MNKILSLQSLHVKESVDLKRASSASVACSRKKVQQVYLFVPP